MYLPSTGRRTTGSGCIVRFLGFDTASAYKFADHSGVAINQILSTHCASSHIHFYTSWIVHIRYGCVKLIVVIGERNKKGIPRPGCSASFESRLHRRHMVLQPSAHLVPRGSCDGCYGSVSIFGHAAINVLVVV